MSILTRFKRHARRRQRELAVETAMLSDVGCVRDHNEDAGVILNRGPGRLLGGAGVLVVLADGMGGHEAGEVASQAVIDVAPRVYFEQPGDRNAAIVRALKASNQAIRDIVAEFPEREGMGTTAVLLGLHEGQAFVGHVGDSRLYRTREGRIEALTQDHSLVRDLVERELISAEAARDHPDKNVILRAVGTQPQLEVETHPATLKLVPGDRFLLCSDGLTDLVRDEEVRDSMLDAKPYETCEAMIALARERGGHDNITVGCIHVLAADAPLDPSDRVPDTRGA